MDSKKHILIADGSANNRKLITDILGEAYAYTDADNGAGLIDYLSSGNKADIILLDIHLPVLGGLEVLRSLKEQRWLEEIPAVIMIDEVDYDCLHKAYTLGAADYILRPFSAAALRFRTENTLMLYNKQRQLVRLVEEQVRDREEINSAMIGIFSHTMEYRNNESGKHTFNIRTISDILLHKLATLTDRYDLTEKKISVIASLSSLHDIGKILIPKKILNKPGPLTEEEWEIMKSHTLQGENIIRTTHISHASNALLTAREICRWHHERWDGKGYPDGLCGDAIPISAQVVSLADVYDALTSDRCYKKAFSHEKAMEMILGGECGVFNPLLLQCLEEVSDKLQEINLQTPEAIDYSAEAQKLTVEALSGRKLPSDNRAECLFTYEKLKKEFLKSVLGGIQFEYDCMSQKITFYNTYEPHSKPQEFFLHSAKENEIRVLSQTDWQLLFDKMQETTPENPDICLTVLIEVNGEYRWHKLNARSIWSSEGVCTCALGQFTDIHDATVKAGIRQIIPDKTTFEMSFDWMKQIFNVVRLVDPTDYSVLHISDNGTFQKSSVKCYEYWHRDECCKYCCSGEALRCQGLKTKLENKGNELYSVISKYMNVCGKDVVLEIAFNLSDTKAESPTVSDRTRLLLLDFYKDSLTNAYSRMYLEDFKESLEKSDAVALIDIDNFKHINDTYGHPVGDTALKLIAETVMHTAGQNSLVIRYGGDEFLLIFNSISEPEFRKKTADIQKAVHEATLTDYPDVSLAISIGGAHRAGSLAEAISAADKEMYKNKPFAHLNA